MYANQNLRKGTVVGPYAGRMIHAPLLQRHKEGGDVGGHYLSLRNMASMSEMQNAIDGAIQREPVNGNIYDLGYFLKNGPASMANCDIPSKCNSNLSVEYVRYDKEMREVFIDDEYCPLIIPKLQRVKCTV